MVFNATFNIILVISWRSVLLMEETGVTWRKPPTCRKSVINLMLYQVHLTRVGFKLTTLMVMSTDCIGSCNYHTISFTKAPPYKQYLLQLYYIFYNNFSADFIGEVLRQEELPCTSDDKTTCIWNVLKYQSVCINFK